MNKNRNKNLRKPQELPIESDIRIIREHSLQSLKEIMKNVDV